MQATALAQVAAQHGIGTAGMIDLYTWTTPNGRKVPILLEEIGLPYRVHPVNLAAGDQLKPEFLRISPNNKIPAIIDHEAPDGRPISLFESGAILVYLADKTAQFLPAEARARAITLQWLMWQMAGVGPTFGQYFHFHKAADEQIPYAQKRFAQETSRLLGVMNGRLAEAEFLAGIYTIADIATFPWINAIRTVGVPLDEAPNVARWYDALAARPAVQRGMAVLQEGGTRPAT